MIHATLNFPPELLLKAQGIRVVFFDVDGVLTDGGLYFTQAGESLKRFNTLDGHGLKLIQRADITPVVITGRDSQALRLRLAALGVEHAHYGIKDKRQAAEQALKTLGLDWHRAATMGDDWPDLALLRRVHHHGRKPRRRRVLSGCIGECSRSNQTDRSNAPRGSMHRATPTRDEYVAQ